MSKKLIVGNWKMNPGTAKEAKALWQGLARLQPPKNTLCIACPPTPYLALFSHSTISAKNLSRNLILGAQNLSFKEGTGALTGEYSAEMLASLGVRYAIIGHSERRAIGETDIMVATKIKNALNARLAPIICVGEKIRDDSGAFWHEVRKQMKDSLALVSKKYAQEIVLAYEPVWAIGSSAVREATPEECKEMMIFIRKVLTDLFGVKDAGKIPIIYGGSVNPKNASNFLSFGGADGLLVGRDSRDPKKMKVLLDSLKNTK